MPNEMTRAHGRGSSAIEDRTFGRDDSNRTERALVVRNIGRDRAHQRVRGIRVGVIHHHIDAAPNLRRCAVEIHDDIAVVHCDLAMDRHGVVEAVNGHRALVDAVRNFFDGVAQSFFGAIQNQL